MRLRSSRINILREISKMTVIRLASSIAGFLVVAILARNFTVSKVGLFFFATAMTYLFSQVPSGFGKAVKKRVSERNSDYIPFFVLGVVFLILYLVLLSIAGYLLDSLFSLSIGDIQISTSLILATFLGVCGKSSTITAREYVSGMGYPAVSQALVFSLYRFGQLVVVAYLVVIVGASDILRIFQLAQLTGVLVLVAAFIATVRIDGLKTDIPMRSEILSVVEFAKWSIITDIFNDLYHRIDTIFLAFFLSSVVVGYYESSVRIMSLAFALPSSTNKVLVVKISGYHTEGEDYTDFFKRYVKMILLFTTSVMIIVYVFGEQILEFGYGTEYIAAYPIFAALMTQLVVQSVRGSFRSLFHGINKPSVVTKVTTVTVIANMLTAPLFIMAFNGVGMVIATVVTELCRVGYFYYLYRQLSNS